MPAPAIESRLVPSGEDFAANRQAMLGLLGQVRAHEARAAAASQASAGRFAQRG